MHLAAQFLNQRAQVVQHIVDPGVAEFGMVDAARCAIDAPGDQARCCNSVGLRLSGLMNRPCFISCGLWLMA